MLEAAPTEKRPKLTNAQPDPFSHGFIACISDVVAVEHCECILEVWAHHTGDVALLQQLQTSSDAIATHRLSAIRTGLAHVLFF